MGNFKNLAGETVVYGFSTILGRLMNWWMLPLYVNCLTKVDNGLLTFLYSYIGIVQVLLTFGFETGFFRFAKDRNLNKVFGTLFSFVLALSLVFLIFGLVFKQSISDILDIHDPSLVAMVVLILASDAIGNIPFAMLRFQNKAIKYSLNRLLQVFIMVSLNLFFLLVYPKYTEFFSWLGYLGIDSSNKLYNVFFSNFIGSLIIPILLSKSILKYYGGFDKRIFKEVFKYSFPIMVVGAFGMFNYNIDKILLLHLLPSDTPLEDLGVYGANFKIGVLMAIFTQSFRMAFEPFFFKNKDIGGREIYAQILNYFVGFGMVIFLGVLLFIDLVNLVITDNYQSGNVIIPYVLLAQLFFGIYYSLSLWYKLTDKTYFALIFTVIGSVVSLIGNFILVPRLGFVGAAISSFGCYFVMALISFFYGQKYYFVPYQVLKISVIVVSGISLYFVFTSFYVSNFGLRMLLNGSVVVLYSTFLWRYINNGWSFKGLC